MSQTPSPDPATPNSATPNSATPNSATPGAAMPGAGMPDYKGAPLDSERGPGLGCFWFQVILFVALMILTPLSVLWAWPSMVSAALLILSLILLFFVGQTMIFLLRLVAADRRTRRRPLAPTARPTVGDLESAADRPVRPDDVETHATPSIQSSQVARQRGITDDRLMLTIYFVLAVADGLVFALVARSLGLTAALYLVGWGSIILALLIRRSFPRRVISAELVFGGIALLTYLLVRLI
ncbi:MAG: hypothetical protein QOJ81_90 [Chloroflexota bacterium]|jgi:hypothetical protein|nr:hypothetical protein [Chloroflexota bacterium]